MIRTPRAWTACITLLTLSIAGCSSDAVSSVDSAVPAGTLVASNGAATATSASASLESAPDESSADGSLPATTSVKNAAEPPDVTLFGDLPASPFDPATVTALQGVVDSSVSVLRPDVIAAVISAQGAWSGAAGVDGPDDRTATTADVFAIASISKMFMSALIMRLADEDQIDLDKPLGDYLGDMAAASNKATVRETLGMRSGLGDTAAATIAKTVAAPDHVWTEDEVVAEFPGPVAPADAAFNYSNPSYKLLGFAAEHVTGLALADAMRSEVIDPAGVPGTVLVQGAGSPTPQPWALPTADGDLTVDKYGTGGALPSVADATLSLAAAGMAADAPSVASWAWQLFAGKVVSAQALGEMMTIGEGGYGLGMESQSGFGPPPVVGHGGSKDGYQSLLVIVPDRQAVIVVFSNRRDADVQGVAVSLLKALPS